MTTDSQDNPKNRLTPDQWIEACALWKAGAHTLDDLSEKFGVSVNALHRRFKRNGITKGSDQRFADEALAEQLRLQNEEKAKEIAASFSVLRELCFKMNTSIVRRVATEIKNATDKSIPLSETKDSMKALEIAQNIVARSFESARNIAGKIIKEEEEDELPKLVVEPLSEEDIKELRRAQEAEEREMFGLDEDLDIIEGD